MRIKKKFESSTDRSDSWQNASKDYFSCFVLFIVESRVNVKNRKENRVKKMTWNFDLLKSGFSNIFFSVSCCIECHCSLQNVNVNQFCLLCLCLCLECICVGNIYVFKLLWFSRLDSKFNRACGRECVCVSSDCTINILLS